MKKREVFMMSSLWLIIVLLTPIIIDLFGKLYLILGPAATSFAQTNLWTSDVLSYAPLYLLILFFIKTTFEPLRVFGYQWHSKYVLLAIYIGVGSGVIMYLVDKNFYPQQVQPFGLVALLGYLVGSVLLPAFTEETLFRGVIQRFYQKAFTKTFSPLNISVAVLLASAAEIIFHLAVPMYFGVTQIGVSTAFFQTLPQIVYVAAFGFIGGVLYQRTGSLAAPIIIHSLGNFTEYILLWFLH